jgi:hypothetical protein
VAASYGKYLYQVDFIPRKPKHFERLHALRTHILKTFAPPLSGDTLGGYYRDIGDSYRIKLMADDYDAVIFPEGMKYSTGSTIVNTIIILSVSDITCVRSPS